MKSEWKEKDEWSLQVRKRQARPRARPPPKKCPLKLALYFWEMYRGIAFYPLRPPQALTQCLRKSSCRRSNRRRPRNLQRSPRSSRSNSGSGGSRLSSTARSKRTNLSQRANLSSGMPTRSKRGSMTSSRITTVSGSSWTNVRVHL